MLRSYVQILMAYVALGVGLMPNIAWTLDLCVTDECLNTRAVSTPTDANKKPQALDIPVQVEEAIKQQLLLYSAAWMAADLSGVLGLFYPEASTHSGLDYTQWVTQIQHELPTDQDASMLFYEIQFLPDEQQRPNHYRTQLKRMRTSANLNDYEHLEYEWRLSEQGQWMISRESLVGDKSLLAAAKRVAEAGGPQTPTVSVLAVEREPKAIPPAAPLMVAEPEAPKATPPTPAPIAVAKPKLPGVTPPSPIAVAKPELSRATPPSPAVAAKPKPLKITPPVPVVATKLEPPRVTAPTPVMAAKPEPKAARPTPMVVVKPRRPKAPPLTPLPATRKAKITPPAVVKKAQRETVPTGKQSLPKKLVSSAGCEKVVDIDTFGVQLMVVRSEEIAIEQARNIDIDANIWIYISPNGQFVLVAGFYEESGPAKHLFKQLGKEPSVPRDVFVTHIKPERVKGIICPPGTQMD